MQKVWKQNEDESTLGYTVTKQGKKERQERLHYIIWKCMPCKKCSAVFPVILFLLVWYQCNLGCVPPHLLFAYFLQVLFYDINFYRILFTPSFLPLCVIQAQNFVMYIGNTANSPNKVARYAVCTSCRVKWCNITHTCTWQLLSKYTKPQSLHYMKC